MSEKPFLLHPLVFYLIFAPILYLQFVFEIPSDDAAWYWIGNIILAPVVMVTIQVAWLSHLLLWLNKMRGISSWRTKLILSVVWLALAVLFASLAIEEVGGETLPEALFIMPIPVVLFFYFWVGGALAMSEPSSDSLRSWFGYFFAAVYFYLTYIFVYYRVRAIQEHHQASTSQ